MRARLQDYADRGVFRSYGELGHSRGRWEFRFRWLSEELCRFVYDEKRRSLTFFDLLPNVPSALDRQLRAFLKERHSLELPPHRRIDPELARVVCYNRRGSVSLTLKLVAGDVDYGVKKVLNLTNDIFTTFLSRPGGYEYVRRNFSIPGE